MSENSKIREFFPWNDANLAEHTVLCLDNNSGNGEFSVNYMIFKFIKQQVPVVLLSCAHGREHYESIFRKNNVDLANSERNGLLQIVALTYNEQPTSKDMTTPSLYIDSAAITYERFVSWMRTGRPLKGDAVITTDNSGNSTSSNSRNSCEAVFKPFALVIDDLEALEIFASTSASSVTSLGVRNLLSECVSDVQQFHEQQLTPPTASTIAAVVPLYSSSPLYSFVAFGRQPTDVGSPLDSIVNIGGAGLAYMPAGPGGGGSADGATYGASGGGSGANNTSSSNSLSGPGFYPALNEYGEPTLSEYLRYRADVVVVVNPLATGFSSDVHGVISVTHSCVDCCSFEELPTVTFCTTNGCSSNIEAEFSAKSNKNTIANTSRSSSTTATHSRHRFGITKGGETLKKQILHFKALDSGITCKLVQ